MGKIWANSGDSHVMEPADVWTSRLPAKLGERAPRTERDERHESVYVDGQTVFRTLNAFSEAARAPGSSDAALRLVDMDAEGIVNQVLFPSAGLWTYRITDPELWRGCARAYNDWMAEEIMTVSPRLVGVALLPLLEADDAIAELHHAADLRVRAVMLATTPPEELVTTSTSGTRCGLPPRRRACLWPSTSAPAPIRACSAAPAPS
jgi:predicted TIM-barrel fold metal-dependent hydrolase